MAKTANDIQELLSTDLFKKGIAKNYIFISSDSDYISYNCKNGVAILREVFIML